MKTSRNRKDPEFVMREGKPTAGADDVMSLYYNLPPEQRCNQQLIARFNADEQLWESLESRRRLRRRLSPRLATDLRKQLDLLDFAEARPLQDCVGMFEKPSKSLALPILTDSERKRYEKK